MRVGRVVMRRRRKDYRAATSTDRFSPALPINFPPSLRTREIAAGKASAKVSGTLTSVHL
jgi:hypothetical protein